MNKIVELSLFPIPVTDIINIKISKNLGYAHLEVMDLSGRVLIRKEEIKLTESILTFDISALAAGSYFLIVEGEAESIHKQFIKQ